MTNELFTPIFHELGGTHGNASPVPTQFDEVRTRLYRIEMHLRRLGLYLTGGDTPDYPGVIMASGVINATTWLAGGGDLKDGPITIALAADMPLLVKGDGTEASEYATGTLALAAAVSGDVVVLPPNTYVEDLTVGAGISLVGAGRGTIVQGTIYAGINALITNLFVDCSHATTGIEYGIRNIDEVGNSWYVSHVVVEGEQSGPGYLRGIASINSRGYLHDCQVNVQGGNAVGLYVDGTLDVGGNDPIVKDRWTEAAITPDIMYVDVATCPPTSAPWAYLWWIFTVDGEVTPYTYLRVGWTGRVAVSEYWGDNLTPRNIEFNASPHANSGGVLGPGATEWLEYPDNYQILQETVDEIGESGTSGSVVIRARDIGSGGVTLYVSAEVERAITDGTARVTMIWSEIMGDAIIADDCQFYGTQYDIYVAAGGIEVQACTYDHAKTSGTIISASGDRSAWDVTGYPTLHASDIYNAARLVHMPDPVAENDIAIVNAAGNWEVLTGPTAANDILIAGADPYNPTWTAGNAMGSGAANQVAYWSEVNVLTGAATLTYNPAASPNLLLTAANAAHIPLVVRLAAVHTANAFEVQSNGGAILTSINKDGYLGIGVAAAQALQVNGNIFLSAADSKLYLTNGLYFFQVGASTLQIVNTSGAGGIGESFNGDYSHTTGSSTATTAGVLDQFILARACTGVPVAGFGVAYILRASSTTSDNQLMGRIGSEWIDPTHATRKARLRLTVYDTTIREAVRFDTDGANVLTAFGGTTVDALTTVKTQAPGATYIPLTVKAAAAQTANLTEWQTSAAAVLAYIDPTGGALFSDKVRFTQTDGNEAIDSLADGYLDYLATTAHRFNNDIYPAADDTYYLGKNDDDTPFAWKGVVLKDTTDGKYYRIEVINGTITATDLTD